MGDPRPTSVEIIVLDEGGHLEDVTAEAGDLPELATAGWHSHLTGVLAIYSRVLW